MDIICICSKIFLSKTILARRTGTFPQNKTSRIFLSLLDSSCMKTKHTHAACNFHSQVYHGNLEQPSIRSHKIVAKHIFYCIFIPDGFYNTFNNQFSNIDYNCFKLPQYLQTGLRHSQNLIYLIQIKALLAKLLLLPKIKATENQFCLLVSLGSKFATALDKTHK